MPAVLILGATSDIGFAIAEKFASEGFDIQLAGRNQQQLNILQTDLTIRFKVNCKVYEFIAENFGEHRLFYESITPKPDVTVYVVGYMNDNEIAFNNWDESLKTINANYTGGVSILNIICADYISKGGGDIVGISSVAGLRGRQSNFIYGSAKAGFSAYLSGLRNKAFPNNVHVMTVLPGFVNTKMTMNLNLPKMLTANPELVGKVVFESLKKKRNTVYVKWFWRWIMLIIIMIPEFIFKKRKL